MEPPYKVQGSKSCRSVRMRVCAGHSHGYGWRAGSITRSLTRRTTQTVSAAWLASRERIPSSPHRLERIRPSLKNAPLLLASGENLALAQRLLLAFGDGDAPLIKSRAQSIWHVGGCEPMGSRSLAVPEPEPPGSSCSRDHGDEKAHTLRVRVQRCVCVVGSLFGSLGRSAARPLLL